MESQDYLGGKSQLNRILANIPAVSLFNPPISIAVEEVYLILTGGSCRLHPQHRQNIVTCTFFNTPARSLKHQHHRDRSYTMHKL